MASYADIEAIFEGSMRRRDLQHRLAGVHAIPSRRWDAGASYTASEITYEATIVVTCKDKPMLTGPIYGRGVGVTHAHAITRARDAILLDPRLPPEPTTDAAYLALWLCFPVAVPLVVRGQPMPGQAEANHLAIDQTLEEWYSESQHLGVDFEGTKPPQIVQIACAQGVYVAPFDDPSARKVLRDPRHVHCVFGAHEEKYCANPRNVQRCQSESLPALAAALFCPHLRLRKDPSIHARTNDWRAPVLPPDALVYAALDAVMTRHIAMRG
jgi:hypothetical protein